MLSFQPTKPSDRSWVYPLLQAEAMPLCSYSFPVLVCWQGLYGQEVCRFEDRLLIHAYPAVGSAYLWPCGTGPVEPALQALEEDARDRKEVFRLVGVLREQLPLLERLYPGRIEVVDRRDHYDYHYDVNRLADLPGKKLHAKRNHIRRFRDNCPDGTFHPLTAADIPDCLALDQRWYEEHLERNGQTADTESLLLERAAMIYALEHFEALGMDGGVIRCHGQVLAFTLGSLLSPTVYDVQFERALADFQGAFPLINQEFARWIRDSYPTVAFIDREEDMGQPGLRKAKLSYGPDRLMENLCVLIHEHADTVS